MPTCINNHSHPSAILPTILGRKTAFQPSPSPACPTNAFVETRRCSCQFVNHGFWQLQTEQNVLRVLYAGMNLGYELAKGRDRQVGQALHGNFCVSYRAHGCSAPQCLPKSQAVYAPHGVHLQALFWQPLAECATGRPCCWNSASWFAGPPTKQQP